MTDIAAYIAGLESEFGEEGFLGLLRAGHFDSRSRDRFVDTLRSIELEPGAPVDRRLVSLLWYLPLLLRWQEPRVDGGDAVALEALEDVVTNELERILGVP